MKQFVTAATEQDADASEALEFDVDGVTCKCYRPTDGQLAILMASIGRTSTTEEGVGGVINFFASTLDDVSHQHLTARLLDRRDSFGLPQVQGIIKWMVEEWTARPTQEPSGSTSSPPSTGSGSTQSIPASI
jgi:hypothetical protein